MKRLVLGLVVAVLLPVASRAADDKDADVVQDLGAVLGWRLAPQIVEEQCRDVDPEGADARKKSLQSWLDKNAAQIKAVDDRVAEIAPLLNPNANGVEMVKAVRQQVGLIVQESIFQGKKGDDLKDICKKEADPDNPRWKDTVRTDVQESLAAMYDWKIRHEKK